MAETTGLPAASLLELADAGDGEGAAERGRLLLAAALPHAGPEALDAMGVGARSRWALELRAATLGPSLPARVTCPGCGRVLAVEVPFDTVATDPPPVGEAALPARVRVEVGDEVAEAREPDGRDLALASTCPDVEGARDALVEACVTGAWRGGEPIAPGELSEAAVERAGEAIVAQRPTAEPRVPLACGGCGLEWAPVLDPVLFFWREIETAAVQLLDEIHQLAVGYGWSEEQSLRLSSRRRRKYVERLTVG